LKIKPCSPNDLRRTCATWLRQDGAPPDLIAPVMGHVDTRMVERVYGRLPLQDREQRLTATLQSAAASYERPRSDDTGTKPACSAFAADDSDSSGRDELSARKRAQKPRARD
jgi:hypothetical protein